MPVSYLKIPIEMAQFALSESKTPKVKAYLAAQFLYPGKVRLKDDPARKIAIAIDVHRRTVKRYFDWLLQRNWSGKDDANGWLFFRGLDRVHKIEDWQYARAVIMNPNHLRNLKAFFAGAVMASLVQTGKGQRTELPKGSSEPAVGPISLSALADTLNLSKSTAFRLRNLAAKCNYIENKLTFSEIKNWRPADLIELKKQGLQQLPAKLSGELSQNVGVHRIRYKNGKLFRQDANRIKPLLQLKTRKGLSKTFP